MSKSKKNVVDPDQIIHDYGADTARWFMLSDSPPERDLEWTEAGVTGAWRFQQRLHRLASEAIASLPPAGAPKPASFPQAATELRRAAHKTIAGVSTDIEAFHFNKAVARLYELANAIGGFNAKDAASRWALRETLEIFVRLIGPMTPHLGEELWQALGHTTLLADAGWPAAEDALLVDDTVTVAVQMNGKLRGTIALPKDAAKDAAEQAALALPEIQRGLDGKTPKRVIVVPNRIVNVVV
jgi:leucyl-tRNA synthetase